MSQRQDFKIGEQVWWIDYPTKKINRGTIEWIENDLYVSIRIPAWDTEKCKVSIAVRKINGQWLVYRSYQGYKELLCKD